VQLRITQGGGPQGTATAFCDRGAPPDAGPSGRCGGGGFEENSPQAIDGKAQEATDSIANQPENQP
jgi:hypothetical protein